MHYHCATTRKIGGRAEVDPALIACYFDGKEAAAPREQVLAAPGPIVETFGSA